MAILEVLVYPHPNLRLVAKPVTTFDRSLEKLIEDMAETMYHQRGVGLAATQVDVHKRLFIMDVSKEGTKLQVFINPELTKVGDSEWEEGCLSLPGVFAKVPVAEQVTIKYQDVTGAWHEETYSQDLSSACIQHENDHLDGILFTDYLSRLKRERLLIKMQKQRASETDGKSL